MFRWNGLYSVKKVNLIHLKYPNNKILIKIKDESIKTVLDHLCLLSNHSFCMNFAILLNIQKLSKA